MKMKRKTLCPLTLFLEDQRQHHADRQLQRKARKRQRGGVPERVPEIWIVKDFDVVAKAYKLDAAIEFGQVV